MENNNDGIISPYYYSERYTVTTVILWWTQVQLQIILIKYHVSLTESQNELL